MNNNLNSTLNQRISASFGNVKSRGREFLKNPVISTLSEIALYSAAYANTALANDNAYMGYPDHNAQWYNPAVLAQTAGPMTLEFFADLVEHRSASSELNRKLARGIGTATKHIQKGIGLGNLAVALYFTPITGGLMRSGLDAVFGPGTSLNVDMALVPIYHANPTAPALIAGANLYAARRER
ncbi:MAG: hypothetical protein AABW92_01415 [Nanoarchaeota archaeon]